jgi:hypothetical protein
LHSRSQYTAVLANVDTVALAPRVPELRAELARLRGDEAEWERQLRATLEANRAMIAGGHATRIEALLADR